MLAVGAGCGHTASSCGDGAELLMVQEKGRAP